MALFAIFVQFYDNSFTLCHKQVWNNLCLFVALYSLHADSLIILIEAGNKKATTTMVALQRYMWACKIHKVSWGPLGGACLGYSPKVKGRLLHFDYTLRRNRDNAWLTSSESGAITRSVWHAVSIYLPGRLQG